jgi:pimeloyl-ACP methyl ester carboxylesterase
VIGWSDGAKVGVMMAIKSQSRIKSLVAISILIRVSKETLAPILWGRNIKNWPKETYDSLHAIYGDSIQLMLDEYVNFWKDVIGKYPSGYLTDDLRLIRCPVLLIHGDQVFTTFPKNRLKS